jgi:hypothetical protein
MKRLASLVALALLVPLSASAAEQSGKKPANKTEKPAAAAPAQKHTKGLGKKTDKKVQKADKGHEHDAHAKGSAKHDDFSHHEPQVTHGVLVSKVSARHRDHADRGKKELPLLPASMIEKVEKPAEKAEAEGSKKATHDGSKKAEHKADKTEHKADKAEHKVEKAEHKADKADKHDAASKKKGHGDKADSKADKKDGRRAEAPKAPCFHDAVELVRGAEVDKFALQRCEGGLAPFALERLSVVLRPSQVARPLLDMTSSTNAESLSKAKTQKSHDKKDDVLPSTVKRVDPGLVERLDLIATHFKKAGRTVRVNVVSGYRPNSTGSLHSHGRAMDVRLEGVDNEELVAFCKSIPDTGCGYYPNSSFVHVDVRDPGAGHVSWIDASGPGESPRYVTEWPPRATKAEATFAEGEPSPPEANAEHGPTAPAKPQEMIDGVKD